MEQGIIIRPHHVRGGDAHAQADGELLEHAAGNGVVNTGDDRVQLAPVLQEQQELVPAHPGGDVRAADALLEPVRQELQHVVAEDVAVCIVGVLEVVQIEDHHGKLAAGPVLDALNDLLFGAGVVEKPRQRIVGGQPLQGGQLHLGVVDIHGLADGPGVLRRLVGAPGGPGDDPAPAGLSIDDGLALVLHHRLRRGGVAQGGHQALHALLAHDAPDAVVM